MPRTRRRLSGEARPGGFVAKWALETNGGGQGSPTLNSELALGDRICLGHCGAPHFPTSTCWTTAWDRWGLPSPSYPPAPGKRRIEMN